MGQLSHEGESSSRMLLHTASLRDSHREVSRKRGGGKGRPKQKKVYTPWPRLTFEHSRWQQYAASRYRAHGELIYQLISCPAAVLVQTHSQCMVLCIAYSRQKPAPRLPRSRGTLDTWAWMTYKLLRLASVRLPGSCAGPGTVVLHCHH